MKKLIALILCCVLALTCAACSGTAQQPTQAAAQTEAAAAEAPAETGTVAEPAEPVLEFTGSFNTSVGEAAVVVKLGSNGVYMGNASHAYGSMDFASGTWTKDGGNVVLTDANGNTYTSTVDGDTCVIEGTWDVGSMPAQQLKLTATAADVDAFAAPEGIADSAEAAPAEPAEPILEFTGSFNTSVGEATVIMKLGSNGVYAANASHAYGSIDFASGSWVKENGNIVLTDANGSTYTSTVDGDTCVIEGTWDVGSMPAQQLKLTADAAAVENF